jgi:hypothetical protein
MAMKASSMMPNIQVDVCMITCKSYCWSGLRKPEDLVRGYTPDRCVAVSFAGLWLDRLRL